MQAGDLINRISYDIDTVNASLSNEILQAAAGIISIAGAFVGMLLISPALLGVFLLTVPLSVLVAYKRSKKMRPLFRRRAAELAKLNGFSEEMLSGLKTIKAYGVEAPIEGKFADANRAAADAYYEADCYGSMLGPAVSLIGNLGTSLIGAAGTLILGLVMGRLKWSNFRKSMEESSRFTAMCFTLLGGATILGYFMTMSRMPTMLANSIASLDVAPIVVMCVIVIVMCVLGCFLPAIPLILITVPIFLPIAKSFHWDLVWFGVIFAILNNMASITPPFGINLFVMKGVADVPLGLIFRAAMPFVLALFVCLALIIAFPQISLLIPSLM